MEQPQPVPQTMVVPLQNAQFLGHMEPGESRTVKFTVSISPDAEEGDFPLSAVVSYNDPWDQQKSSNVETFGVRVEKEMQVRHRPRARGDQVRPLLRRQPDPDQQRLGAGPRRHRAHERPGPVHRQLRHHVPRRRGAGGERDDTFGIKVKPDAVPGEYYVTLEVKYYDAQDDPHVTKIIRKAIVVFPPPTLLDTVVENWPLALGFALLVLLGIAYMGYKWLAKRRKPPGAAVTPPEESGRLITEGAGDEDKKGR